MAASIKMFRRLLRSFAINQSQTHSFFSTCRIHRAYKHMNVKNIMKKEMLNESINVKGWVRTIRKQKKMTFFHINDGSGPERLQVVMDRKVADACPDFDNITFGSCLSMDGNMVESLGPDQDYEFLATGVKVIGACSDDFPIKIKAKHAPAYLREHMQFRPKYEPFASLLRIRSQAAFAVHQHFQNEGCILIHTPCITSNDCEGGGNTFKIESAERLAGQPIEEDPAQKETSAPSPKELYDQIVAQGNIVREGKKDKAQKETIVSSVKYLVALKADFKALCGEDWKMNMDVPEPTPDKSSSDLDLNCYFGKPAHLTVSGQLHLEVITGGLPKVYNFGPAFRAEGGEGSFHLSEFHMVEAEYAFMDDLGSLLDEMEKLVKAMYGSVMEKCHGDVVQYMGYMENKDFFMAHPEEGEPQRKMEKMEKLLTDAENIITKKFERLTYTEAVELLIKCDQTFTMPVKWGVDLNKQHEMTLCQLVGDAPLFLTDYPADLKPFYARRNPDGQTVAAADLLLPRIGELCGSSLREERPDVLQEVMEREGLMKDLSWYLDLRRCGGSPTGGFGLGFDRMLLGMLGASGLRDVVPFPRQEGKCIM